MLCIQWTGDHTGTKPSVGWSSYPGCVWGRTNIISVLPYKYRGMFRFVSLNTWSTTEVWIPTVSTEEQHIPNQSLCAPKALCHVHCHGVMTTAATESALYLVDWGPHRYKAFHLPLRVDTTHKYHAPMLCGMVFMFWVCLGQDQHHSCCAIQAPRNV